MNLTEHLPASAPVLGRQPPYRLYFLLLACGWTLAVAGSLVWNLVASARERTELTLETARALIDKDVLYRRWNARCGGVYVPVTPQTPPNPLLKAPERDLVTPSGKRLTLVNPAYMTRQVLELQDRELGARGHITSLKPLRPENAPDAWERQALQSFERGRAEASVLERVGGQSRLRLMRPLLTEPSCLECHAEQGYKSGDVRGGISVTLPTRQSEALASGRELFLAHGGLWGLGLLGLFAGSRHLRGLIEARRSMEDHLCQLSRAVEQSPAAIILTDPRGRIEYANPKYCRVAGYTADEARGLQPWILRPGETSPEEYRQLWETIAAGLEWRGQFHRKAGGGRDHWEQVSISPIVDAAGRTTHLVLVKEDITERKAAEAERERLIAELRQALAEVKTLSGIIPICGGCKKIRDDRGFWNQVESYIAAHSLAQFSHGLCPDCLGRYFPSVAENEVPERAAGLNTTPAPSTKPNL